MLLLALAAAPERGKRARGQEGTRPRPHGWPRRAGRQQRQVRGDAGGGPRQAAGEGRRREDRVRRRQDVRHHGSL